MIQKGSCKSLIEIFDIELLKYSSLIVSLTQVPVGVAQLLVSSFVCVGAATPTQNPS